MKLKRFCFLAFCLRLMMFGGGIWKPGNTKHKMSYLSSYLYKKYQLFVVLLLTNDTWKTVSRTDDNCHNNLIQKQKLMKLEDLMIKTNNAFHSSSLAGK